jgi:spore maturation protein CgeB
MKMIYAGSLSTKPDRDSGWIRTFSELGLEVIPFSTDVEYTEGVFTKLKRRFSFGRENREMQSNLLRLAKKAQACWVHFRLPIPISRSTIEELKRLGYIVTEYFNDDPFSQKSPFGLHWKFKKALPSYDYHFVYRQHNVAAFKRAHATHVGHCPPTWDPSRHYPIYEPDKIDFKFDAAFIGHFENDCRLEHINALRKAGYTVIIHGSGWPSNIKSGLPNGEEPIRPLFGKDYNRLYQSVHAGLCFFSKINRDSWTERPLEIIAVGGILTCERTDEAVSRFREGEEAFFFSTPGELVEIVQHIKSPSFNRSQMLLAARARLMSNADSISERGKSILDKVLNMISYRSAR